MSTIRTKHENRRQSIAGKIGTTLFRIPALLLIFFFLALHPLSAQEKMTQKELDEAVKMMKANGMPPETIEMFKKMVQVMPEGAKKGVAEAISEAMTTYKIPKKDNARIQRVSKKIFSLEELEDYISRIVTYLEQKIDPENKALAQAIMDLPESADGDQLGITAGSLWVMRSTDAALLLMGKAALLSPTLDNLNNFSAFLNMMNVPEVSIPILNRLNSDFPGYSPVLNNLGQAWFSLGDFNKAQEYLDEALKKDKKNSQANLTKALILSATSNSPQKFDFIAESITSGFSEIKVELLQSWGGDLKKSKVKFEKPEVDDDILNLQKILNRVPDWPDDVGEVILLTPAWENFIAELNNEYAESYNKLTELSTLVFNNSMKQTPESRLVNLSPKSSTIWRLYGDELRKSKDPKLEAEINRYSQDWWLAQIDAVAVGDADPFDCPAVIAELNERISTWTYAGQKYYEPRKDYQFYKSNENAYISMLTSGTAEEQEISFLQNRNEFLFTLSTLFNLKVPRGSGFLPDPKCLVPRKKTIIGELPDYDNEHCNNKINFTIPGVATWGIHCNRGFFDIHPLGIPLSFKIEQNLLTKEVTSATLGVTKGNLGVNVGYNFKKSKWTAGAEYTVVKAGWENYAEISSTVSITVEFDRNGISDIKVPKIGAGVTVIGTKGGIENYGDQPLVWNSGPGTITGGAVTGDLGYYITMPKN